MELVAWTAALVVVAAVVVTQVSGLGLGDLVALAAEAVGLEPCAACDRRRQLLNRLLPGR